jgi:hypothetical protein
MISKLGLDSHEKSEKPRGRPAGADESWLTVTEAATIAGVNSGIISREADDGKLKSNGQSSRARRIDSVDLTRWILERSRRPESSESDEQVKRSMRKAGFKD